MSAHDEATDPALLSDAALEAELGALLAAADRDALADPLTLARHLDHDRIVTRPHLRVIAAAFAEMAASPGARVLITTPPQVGKTELAAIWGPFWWLCRNPRQRVIIGSYASHLATKRGRSIRRLVQTYGDRYGLHLERGSSAANDWTLAELGGVRSVGVGAGVTGMPGELLIIDDPHKGRSEAESPRIRESVWDWWSGDLVSRLAPGAPVCVIQTRWHEEDLAGRLLLEEGRQEEGGKWKVVHLPALALPPDEVTGPDGLGRSPGEPLPHPRIATRDVAALQAHWEEKRRSSTPRDWGALYLGTPKPIEGALVSRETLRRQRDYRPAATPVKSAVAIDPSGGGRSTAGIIGCWLGDDRRLYLAQDRTAVMSSLEWSEAACRLAYEIDADRFVVEVNYGGDMAERVIRSAWKDLVGRAEIDERRLIPRVVVQSSRAGKVLRAEPVAGQFDLDRIRFAAPMPETEEEWATWQDGSPDSPGRIDASVHAALNLLPIPNSGQLVSSPTHVSRESVPTSGAAGMPTVPRHGGAPPGAQVTPEWR